MDLIIKMLDNLSEKLNGETNKADYADAITSLDARTKLMLDTLGYDPEKGIIPLFRETDEARLRTAKQDAANMEANPITALPYAVAALSDSIGDQVRNDLLAFATDFEYAGCLSFRISLMSFGPHMLRSTYNEVSGQEAGEAQLKKMLTQGYVVQDKKRSREGMALVDCEANRKLLAAYCAEHFGDKIPEMRTGYGEILDLQVRIDPADCKFNQKPKEPSPLPADTLTPDELPRVKKAISDYKFALASHQAMANAGSGNTTLAVMSSYMYELEQIFGVHGVIWEQKEAQHAKSRTINQEIRAVGEGMYARAVEIFREQARELFGTATRKLEALTEPLGLYPLDFKLLNYGAFEFRLVPSPFALYDKEILLKNDADPNDCREFYPCDSEENVDIILDHIHDIMSSCELERMEVGFREGRRSIKSAIMRSNKASDLKRLFDLVDAKKN